MALTRRGKLVTALVGACIFLTAGVGALALTGNAPAPLQQVVDTVTGHDEPPPTCPLTGLAAPKGGVPQRTALAVKVENTDDAYPLAGLEGADLIYEEVVEGGITRFIAIYHCGGASRVSISACRGVLAASSSDSRFSASPSPPAMCFEAPLSSVNELPQR